VHARQVVLTQLNSMFARISVRHVLSLFSDHTNGLLPLSPTK
jgi:hypothetical protein